MVVRLKDIILESPHILFSKGSFAIEYILYTVKSRL